VELEADGKLMDGRDVAVACLLGAEEFGFGTHALLSHGLPHAARLPAGHLPHGHCHAELRAAQALPRQARARGQLHDLFVAEELRHIMAELGFRTVEEMVGHPECLRQQRSRDNWKANTIDLSPSSQASPTSSARDPGRCCPHFLPEMGPADELSQHARRHALHPYTRRRAARSPQHFHADIANVNRCVGTMLGSEVTASTRGPARGLDHHRLRGLRRQSFGAFLPAASRSTSGDANDYFGKGLSGGILTVAPAPSATYKFDENVSIGNVAFYGATSGKGFINGLAGQRFGVRNSGATIVCEGVGNHGCEYMTGGMVLILGEVGINFAAGMSGGVAYVYDEYGTLQPLQHSTWSTSSVPTSARSTDHPRPHRGARERTKSPRGIKMLYMFDDIKDRTS
jgi:glutamate synthase (ferredoxin)